MNPPTYDVVLLDLGGVVIDFSGPVELVELVAEPLTAAEIKRLWGEDPCVATLERGDSSGEEFARCFLERWQLDLAADEFLERFAGWTKRWLPGAQEVLAALRPRYHLACLSNSNPIHWQRNFAVHRIHEHFRTCLASHELHALKPEPEIFARALGRLGAKASEVVFFDDSPVNVEGARAFGIDAHRVDGPAELRDKLNELRLL